MLEEPGNGVTGIANGLYDLQYILAGIVGLGLCTECGLAGNYMKLPSYLHYDDDDDDADKVKEIPFGDFGAAVYGGSAVKFPMMLAPGLCLNGIR